MILYRYEIDYSNVEEPETGVRLKEYPVIRETEHTYFIEDPRKYRQKKIRKDAYNTFAYTTIEKAKEHFIRRTRERVRWYEYWLEECKKGLKIMGDEW